MVDKIYDIKNQILEHIDQEIRDHGTDRVDASELGGWIDMVNDLAEAEESCWKAEYYRSVTEAMERGGSSGHTSNRYEHDNQYEDFNRRSGWQNQYGSGRNSSRRGYTDGVSGHHDIVDSLRHTMQNVGPEERERLREQIRSMTDSM